MRRAARSRSTSTPRCRTAWLDKKDACWNLKGGLFHHLPGDVVAPHRQGPTPGQTVLLVVPQLNSDHVLVIVRESRIVLFEHQGDPNAEDVARVADASGDQIAIVAKRDRAPVPASGGTRAPDAGATQAHVTPNDAPRDVSLTFAVNHASYRAQLLLRLAALIDTDDPGGLADVHAARHSGWSPAPLTSEPESLR